MGLLNTLYNRLFRETFVPLALMVITPNAALVFPYIIVRRKAAFYATFANENLWSLTKQAWSEVDWFDAEVWAIIVGTFVWGILTMLLIPARMYQGPPTRNNFRPTYWDNGFRFYLLSMSIACPLIWKYSMLHYFYKFPTFCAILAVVGGAFCVFLYLKGLVAPSPGEHGSSGNLIFDFYWGIELYPTLGHMISLKVLINSRFGLFLWQLVVLVLWKCNYELYRAQYARGQIVWPIAVSSILQTVYLAKFYYWENGYMKTIDTTVDRFGYYIGWGCFCFVPSFYPVTSLYLVKNSPVSSFNPALCSAILILGLFSIFANYWVDAQKLAARDSDGDCVIWGQKAVFIRAKYRDDFGKEQSSLLLASGWWGVARHLNYMFEVILNLAFCLPAYATSLAPYAMFLFLTVLLVHRSVRDENKCSAKYGRYWKEYTKKVPYRIIPYVF